MIINIIFICKNTYQADASEELVWVHPALDRHQHKQSHRNNLHTTLMTLKPDLHKKYVLSPEQTELAVWCCHFLNVLPAPQPRRY